MLIVFVFITFLNWTKHYCLDDTLLWKITTQTEFSSVKTIKYVCINVFEMISKPISFLRR